MASEDFEQLRIELAKTRGPVALGNEVQRVRIVFKYAYDTALIDKPVRYGPTFKRPSKRVLRHARHAKGQRMFESHELRVILNAAETPLRAMILLGVNGGFGNADCGTLPVTALDLDTGCVNHPRPKAGIPRSLPLWSETIAAIQEALSVRPDPKDEHSGLVFVTKYGNAWGTARQQVQSRTNFESFSTS